MNKFVVLSSVVAIASAQSPGNPPCFLCGAQGETISNPDAVIPIPPEFEDMVPFDITCQIGKDFGEQGFVEPFVCDILNENLLEVQELCGCSNFMPVTDEPTLSPTVPATEEPTPSPTDEPTPSPTEPPDTESPTISPTDIITDAPTLSPTEPIVEPTPSPTAQVVEPTPSPTEPIVEPTPSPTEPVVEPTPSPTEPVVEPTPSPTEPVVEPTPSPTAPVVEPTPSPTEPVVEPTPSPTEPVVQPTPSPTEPVVQPTRSPTEPTTPSPTMGGTPSPTPPGTESPTKKPGSSLVCENGKCTFSRVDTDGFALNPYTKVPTMYPTHVYFDEEEIERTESEDPATEKVVFDVPPYEPYLGPFNETTIAPWTDPENQDALSEMVAITRDYRGIIFNALDPDNVYDNYNGPSGTEWALLPSGKTFDEARCQLEFGSWYDSFAMGSPEESVGKAGVVHLIEEDVYYNIMFTQWTSDYGDYDDYRDYPNSLGGGFQYIRDEVPFSIADLPECPVCSEATTNPKQITGPIDDTFVVVDLEGITPENATVTIIAVGQDTDPKCNSLRDGSAYAVRPNARYPNGTSVELRRTQSLGPETPFWYTIYFLAESEGGTCRGETRICVPVPGYGCDDYLYGYDATIQKVCLG